MELRTERLVLRPLERTDLDALAPFYADPEVMRFIGSARTLTRDEARAGLERMIARYDADGFGQLAVVRAEDGRLVGRVGLLVWDTRTWTPSTARAAGDAGELELGWKLGRGFWGRGYATEAATAVREWALGELGATRLISLIHPDNTPSIRVAEKLGMTYEREVELGAGAARLYALSASPRR